MNKISLKFKFDGKDYSSNNYLMQTIRRVAPFRCEHANYDGEYCFGLGNASGSSTRSTTSLVAMLGLGEHFNFESHRTKLKKIYENVKDGETFELGRKKKSGEALVHRMTADVRSALKEVLAPPAVLRNKGKCVPKTSGLDVDELEARMKAMEAVIAKDKQDYKNKAGTSASHAESSESDSDSENDVPMDDDSSSDEYESDEDQGDEEDEEEHENLSPPQPPPTSASKPKPKPKLPPPKPPAHVLSFYEKTVSIMKREKLLFFSNPKLDYTSKASFEKRARLQVEQLTSRNISDVLKILDLDEDSDLETMKDALVFDKKAVAMLKEAIEAGVDTKDFTRPWSGLQGQLPTRLKVCVWSSPKVCVDAGKIREANGNAGIGGKIKAFALKDAKRPAKKRRLRRVFKTQEAK